MAPLPIIAQTFRVALNWDDGAGQRSMNVLNFRCSAAGKTAAQVLTCLDTHVTAGMWGPVSNGYAVETVQCTPLDGISATDELVTGEPAKWTGNVAGNPVPQVAGLVKFRTADRGPRFRGRCYLPYLSEGVINAGAIDSTVVTATSAAWTTFLAAVAADGTTPMVLVVASYKYATQQAVSNVTLEPQTATQKRRQDRNRR